MMILWQEFPTSLLPSPGVVITSVIAAVLAYMNWRQRAWRSTSEAAVVEKNLYKEAAERERQDKEKLALEVAALNKQRDLQPLATAISAWVAEGRGRFDKADNSLNENTLALRSMIDEMKAQRITFESVAKQSEDAYRSLTASFISHTIDDKQQQLEQTRIGLQIANAINEIEDRLSQVAVHVGYPKWEQRRAAGEKVNAAISKLQQIEPQ